MLDWSQEESDKVLEPAILKLGEYSKEAICQFQEILSIKLFDLDAKRFAEELGSNAWPPDEEHGRYFSVDDFLYSRCAVIANGKRFYESVIRDPSRIPKEFTFEPLLYLADRAWSRKTAEPLDCFPALRLCWDFSNRSANCTFLLILRSGNPHLAQAKLRFPCPRR